MYDIPTMKRTITSILLLATSAFLLPFPALTLPARAAVFDPGLVITEQDLFRPGSMDAADIQRFLDEHDGVLKSYFHTDVDGLLKTAAMIIADAAARHQVNPQYLLVLLQKEQGLITNPQPKPSQLEWATGYAACDSCDVDHPGLQKYRGFAQQVDWAARRTRYFYENQNEFVYKPGNTYTINGQEVYIKNEATAVMYNYTPHISGNRLLWRIFTSWFRPVTHPDGTLLQEYGEPGVWLIARNGMRHAFKSKAALTSRFRLEQIIQTDRTALEQYPVGPAIAHALYSLVLDTNGKVFLITNEEKRWIEDETAFRSLGFTWDEVTPTTDDDLAFFTEGDPINAASAQPFGALIQDPETYGIYYVVDGMKHPLLAPELLTLNFNGMRVRKASSPEELERYPKGAPVLLNDGSLVKTGSDPRVFVIANGKKLPIYSETTFNALGYQWTNIQTVSEALLDLHELGDTLRVEPLTDDEIEAIPL